MEINKPFHEMIQIEKIIAFEQGDLSDHEIIDLFQDLCDSGLVWDLQGSYGRTAKILNDLGYISIKKNEEK